MANEVHRTQVTRPVPADLSGVKDDGMKALVMLAHSLGFKYQWKSGKPVILWAADQTEIIMPTETSINASVFQAKLNSIMTHYDAYHFEPTLELIDEIIKVAKPNRDQARLLRLALGETVEQTRKRMAAHEAGPATHNRNEEHLTQRIIVHDFNEKPPLDDGYVYKLHEIKFGGENKVTGVYYYYNSTAVLDRFDAKGNVSYICRFCHEHGRPPYVVKQPSGIGVHWGEHVKAGDVEPQDRKVDTLRSDGAPVKRHPNIVPRKRKLKPGTKAFRQEEREKEMAAVIDAEVEEERALEAIDALIDERHEASDADATSIIPTPFEAEMTVTPNPEVPVKDFYIDENLTDEQKIWAIRNIIDDGQVEKLQAENTRLATRVASLESDLRALKDLIGGIK